MKAKPLRTIGFIVLTACSLLPSARAGTTWTGGAGDGDWHNAGNWSGGVPTAGATAIFGAAGPGTITLGADGIAARLRQRFDGIARTFAISPSATTSATLTLDGSAAELIDAAGAVANFTFDGTPNGNGARLSMIIGGNKPTAVNAGVTLGFYLDVAGAGHINLGAGTAGAGTIALGGINTYSGNTTVVNGGTISLLDDARLTFYIGANGVNNRITFNGTPGGTVLLDGDFDFDLTGADLTHGNSWNIVDVANLSATFGTTFSVLGFTESSDVWTKTSGPYTWTFTEATGVLQLAVIPEPSATALALLGGLGLMLLRFRHRIA